MALTLLDLPAEVRKQIWSHVTLDAVIQLEHVVQHPSVKPFQTHSGSLPCACRRIDSFNDDNDWAFLQTCKLIRTDAAKFRLDCDRLRLSWRYFLRERIPTRLLHQTRYLNIGNFGGLNVLALIRELTSTNGTTQRPTNIVQRTLQFTSLETIYLPKVTTSKTFPDTITSQELDQAILTRQSYYSQYINIVQSILPHVRIFIDAVGYSDEAHSERQVRDVVGVLNNLCG